MIMSPPNPQVVNSNEDITFMCVSLRVFPQHQVSWVFTNSSGKEMELIQTHDSGNSSKYGINRESGTTKFGTLTILNVTFEDRGIYTCNASSDIGYTETSANLTVQGRCTVLESTLEHQTKLRSDIICYYGGG